MDISSRKAIGEGGELLGMPAERNARQRSGFRGWLLGRKGYKHTVQARAKNANVPTLGTINPTGKLPITTKEVESATETRTSKMLT
jgi:hypothetical protein